LWLFTLSNPLKTRLWGKRGKGWRRKARVSKRMARQYRHATNEMYHHHQPKAKHHVPIRPLPNRFRAIEIANRPRAPRRRREELRRRDRPQGIPPPVESTPAPSGYGPACHGSCRLRALRTTRDVECVCVSSKNDAGGLCGSGGGWAFGFLFHTC
jgi:hypothetical protein